MHPKCNLNYSTSLLYFARKKELNFNNFNHFSFIIVFAGDYTACVQAWISCVYRSCRCDAPLLNHIFGIPVSEVSSMLLQKFFICFL